MGPFNSDWPDAKDTEIDKLRAEAKLSHKNLKVFRDSLVRVGKERDVADLQIGDLRRELELARHVYCARTCEEGPHKVHEATCAGMTAALQRTKDSYKSDPDQVFGGHKYPGTAAEEFHTSDCENGCGCWMGSTRSGGPRGVDPFGICPKA